MSGSQSRSGQRGRLDERDRAYARAVGQHPRTSTRPARVGRTVEQRRVAAAELLTAAQAVEPEQSFTVDGHQLTHLRAWSMKLMVTDSIGRRHDLRHEKKYAFWAWAAVNVLRLTGIRIEELTEITHHSLIQYRLPTTSESCCCCRSHRPRPTPNGCYPLTELTTEVTPGSEAVSRVR